LSSNIYHLATQITSSPDITIAFLAHHAPFLYSSKMLSVYGKN